MEKREALYGRLNKWLLVAFIAINYGMGIWNVVRGDTFHYVLAFSSVLFVPVVWLFYKLFKLKPVNQLGTLLFRRALRHCPLRRAHNIRAGISGHSRIRRKPVAGADRARLAVR